MPPSAVLAIIAIFLTVDAVVLLALRQWVKLTYIEIAREFPPREPLPGAVRKRWQSISIDLINMGWSVEIAADEWGLHFVPMGLGRLFAAKPFSVPFDAVKLQGKRRGRWFQKARIGKWDLTGPAWALGLVGGRT